MKINFTKAEYRILLDVVYLGEWMLTAHDTEEAPEKEKYEDLVQKIYSHAREMDCESLIEGSKEMNKYFPTREFEEESAAHEFIEAYDDDSFWEELIERLTQRDVNDLTSTMTKEPETVEDYWEIASSIEERYATEFSSNGLRRLKISET